jgi:hypothetical protein
MPAHKSVLLATIAGVVYGKNPPNCAARSFPRILNSNQIPVVWYCSMARAKR